MKNKFNLFSLTGRRLEKSIQQCEHYDLDSYSLNQIIKILHDNSVHLLSRPQAENQNAVSLADSIFSFDPRKIHYVVRSEAEHNLFELLDKTEYFLEAEDIIEAIENTGFSFVQYPNTHEENVWSFIAGSAPVIYSRENKEFLPVDHPTIQRDAYLGRQKRMRFTY